MLFTLASETQEPAGSLICIGVGQCHAIIGMHSVDVAEFDPETVQWTSVGPEGWSEVGDVLPRGDITISPERAAELEEIFGPKGTWSAINIGRDEARAQRLN